MKTYFAKKLNNISADEDGNISLGVFTLQQTLDTNNTASDQAIILNMTGVGQPITFVLPGFIEMNDNVDNYDNKMLFDSYDIESTLAERRLILKAESFKLQNTNNNYTVDVQLNPASTTFTPIIYWPNKTDMGPYELATKDDFEPQIHITSDLTFSIVPVKGVAMLTLEGTVTTITLPPVAGNEGLIVFITNAGSGVSILNSNTGGNDIWEGGTNFTTTNIPNATIMRLINDGLKYRVL